MKKTAFWISLARKACLLMAGGALLLGVCGCSSDENERSWQWEDLPKAELTGVTINVYNWGEYIDEDDVDVNSAFTHLTGIKVNYKTFTDNESMYAILSAGTADYDVIVPSDYMIGKMRNENRLQKLNFDNIPNARLIDSFFLEPDYDPTGEYSVPYTWGTAGIFYNKKHVKEADLQQGWGLLWNEDYKGNIIMFGNPRDAFGVALKKLGYSMNSVNPDEYQAAYDELVKQKPLLYQYAMDELYDKMISEEAYIAPYYAGDMLILEENPDIDFFVPEEGTNWFVDAMCIPVGARHKAEAEAYINFMCRTEVSKANSEYHGYSTPQVEAREQLDPAIGENPIFYPPDSVMEKAEVFKTLSDDINTLMNSLWNKLLK